MAPLASPPTLGVKVTLKVTLSPCLRLTGRLKPLTPKPAPVMVAWEMVTVELP